MNATDRSSSGVVEPGERCPCCGRRLPYIDGTTGELLNRAIDGAVLAANNAPLYYRCQACLARWNPYLPGHRLHAEAQTHVDAWPAKSLRTPAQAWEVTPVRLSAGGVTTDLYPAPAHHKSPEASEFLTSLSGGSPVFVLTAWNPRGRPGTLAQNMRLHQALVRDVHARGLACDTAVSFRPGVGWAEGGVAIRGVSVAKAHEFATVYHQPAFLEWSVDGLRIRGRQRGTDEADGAASERGFDVIDGPWVGLEVGRADESCAMRLMGDRGSESGRCRNPGGGWISAAIHESLRWKAQRQLFRDTIGCETCAGPKTEAERPRGDGVIGIQTMTVSGRYGPARPTT